MFHPELTWIYLGHSGDATVVYEDAAENSRTSSRVALHSNAFDPDIQTFLYHNNGKKVGKTRNLRPENIRSFILPRVQAPTFVET